MSLQCPEPLGGGPWPWEATGVSGGCPELLGRCYVQCPVQRQHQQPSEPCLLLTKALWGTLATRSRPETREDGRDGHGHGGCEHLGSRRRSLGAAGSLSPHGHQHPFLVVLPRPRLAGSGWEVYGELCSWLALGGRIRACSRQRSSCCSPKPHFRPGQQLQLLYTRICQHAPNLPDTAPGACVPGC